MNKPNISTIFKTVQRFTAKHSPEILTGIGIAGMVTTTILAVRATPKALSLIEDERSRQNYELRKAAKEFGAVNCEQLDRLKPMEVVKVAWKPYIPAVVTGVASVGCIIGGCSVNTRRTAALATAYKISETALTEYKDKVVETIGEKKEKTVRDKIAKEQIEKNPMGKTEIVVTGKGKTLFYDALTGRYFESDIETIKKAANEINRRITLGDMYASLNDFYVEIGLSHTDVGDILGWNCDNLVELDFSAQISDDDRPCLVMGFLHAPKHGFSDLY